MKKCLIVTLILFSQQLFTQEFAIELEHHDPTSTSSDLKALDSYFQNKRLIALGESTHGTHEFFTMRHRIIRYLVENHGLNTIFMELDFANSLAINEYILGKRGTAENAVANVGLWPLMTQEFVDFVEWLKEYNETNPDHTLELVGVDVQKLDKTVDRLERLLAKYGLPQRENEIIDAAAFYKLSDKDLLKLRSIEIPRYQGVDASTFSKDDQYEYKWLYRHLDQILSEKMEKKSMQSVYRDKMMAENILTHLGDDSQRKRVYWAHNGHLAYLFEKKKNRGVAGGYLKEALGDQYFILGLEFDYGSFNARIKSVEEANKWELKVVEVGESPDGSMASNYRVIGGPIIFIPFDRLPDDEMVYINFIGAVYWTNKNGEAPEYLRKNHHGREAFDAILLIKESTPTQLLTK